MHNVTLIKILEEQLGNLEEKLLMKCYIFLITPKDLSKNHLKKEWPLEMDYLNG